MMTTCDFMERFMRRRAYAKLTLYLHATHRDGKMLHFRNVIVPIDLFDMVYLEKDTTTHIETDKDYLPNDKRNTVYKAISLMKKTYGIKDNFKVGIVKNIPAQAGLGGGSADAAAVIHMIKDMYHLDISDHELISIAAQIDEDTPFCLFNRPHIVEGIGDRLTPIETQIEMYYLMVKPAFGVSTKSFLRRYQAFRSNYYFDRILEGLKTNNYKEVVKNTHNDFQSVVMKRNGRLRKVIRALKDGGLDGVCMSGSGTTIFGLSEDIETVQKLYDKIIFDYPFVKYGKIQNGCITKQED